MNDLTLTGNTVTMTSREIAELTVKQHQHVKRDIESMLKDLGKDPSSFGRIYRDTMNREQVEYLLDRELTETLITGYSVPLRHRVIQKLHTLEILSTSAPIPKTYAEALRIAADQAERIEQQQAQIAAAAPKVAFVEQYVEGTGLKGFRQVCKLLGANENEFRLFLADAHVWYRLGGEWVPYAEHIAAGRFHVKTGQAGNGHNFNAAKFTPKGIEWIAGKWAAYKLQGAA